jgi:2,7-dihydroxy-5-methyl-1-naphthoate 7-O-methyltransferase
MSQPGRADLPALSDLQTPWCLRAVVTLRIAQHIAAGAVEIAELAALASCHPAALQAVLRHLVGKGVFEEPAPGRFTLNEAARGLLDPAMQFGLDLDGIGGRFTQAWSTLPAYVRTGEPAYRQLFGRPFWEDLEAHPHLGESFDALMGPAGHGPPEAAFAIDGGWAHVRTVVDVGGGTGAMLAGVLRQHPHLQGTLVDFPRTVARAAEIFRSAGVDDRVSVVGQSFFDPLPAGADLYLLRKVLNDWPDAEATAILGSCAAAAGPSGRVVIIGAVATDAAPARLEIETLLVGGTRRSLPEFSALAAAAGLELSASGAHPAGFVVECRRRRPPGAASRDA